MKTMTKIILCGLAVGIIACGSSTGTSTSLGNSTLLTENFTGTNGDNWSTGWSTTSGMTATIAVDIQTNRGHLQSNVYNGINSNTALTRVYNAINVNNADVLLSVEFEDFANQGVGLYLRQNGGYLTDSATNGQGYGVFWEGNGTSNVGFWTELVGVETFRNGLDNPISSVVNNTKYYIRYQVQQQDSSNTFQRVKVWLASSAEPSTWLLETQSSYTDLQNISGGFAVDLFNFSGSASIYIDDVVITSL